MSRKIILNVPHASLEGVFDRRNGWNVELPSLQKQVMNGQTGLRIIYFQLITLLFRFKDVHYPGLS